MMENPFTQREWIQIGVALVAGGACGTIIKILYDAFQRRAQPVGHFVQFEKMFTGIVGQSRMSAELKISDGSILKSFNNVFVGKIEIENKGNVDMDEFQFGITLGGGDAAVFVETEKVDRHHSIKQIGKVSPKTPAREIDFLCKPFNRRDKYVCRIFVSIPAKNESPKEIHFSTSQPVKFVDLLKRHNLIRGVVRAIPPTDGILPRDIPRVINQVTRDQD